MSSERTRRRWQDIADDAGRIARFLSGMDASAFAGDDRTLLAVERLLQRITEAVVQIGAAEVEAVAPATPVRQIRDFGNFLRHQYADVDAGVVFTIATEDVPVLAEAAARALSR